MSEQRNADGPVVLCLSRSYLSRLLPALEARHTGARYLHIVQTDRERAHIESIGGTVVMSMETVVREALAEAGPEWREPAEFREVTNFQWSPLAADRYLPSFRPGQQSRIAGALYEALEEIFASRRIDAFLSEPVAQFVTHCLFYLSRKHGARRLIWANAWFPDWFYFADDISIAQPVRSAPMSADERARVAAAAEAFVDGVVNDRRGPAYHPSFIERPLSALSILKQRRGEEPLVMQSGVVSRLIQRARLARAQFARLRFPRQGDYMRAGAVPEHRHYLQAHQTRASCYDPLPDRFDPASVVYPLQYEPEASLLYFAPDFRDQPVFVENALRAMPANGTLWVKEHPNQFGALGAPVWQELKRKYGALRLIHGHQSGRELIRKAGLVLTISSSAGMDGLVLGRKVAVAGSVFYRGWEGTIPVGSYAELSEVLNSPASYALTDSRDQIIARLAQFGASCYFGDPQPRHGLFSPENLDHLVAAVDAECREERSA